MARRWEFMTPALKSQVESEAGKVYVAEAAAIARAYEARKKEAGGGSRTTGRPKALV